jgi:hypothetical protein
MDQDYEKIKAMHDKLVKDKERATGAIEELTKRLKKDFGCSDLESAMELLATMKIALANRQKKCDKLKLRLKKKLGDKANGL